MEYPAEVWLNEQPADKRLILHVVTYDKPLCNEKLSVRADLIAGGNIEVVYPVEKKTIIRGKRSGDYVNFILPEVYEHFIFAMKSGR
jgi:hypothetical protein